ncbi:MAG: hypothetical protein IPI35_21040 [Deltaproteobacteria bacterium]|nr:hypothetical protein [Deltaproteobacteria bacterium]
MLIVQWRRCSKMADFFWRPTSSTTLRDRPSPPRCASTGLNELIENLAKFSANKQKPVSIEINHYGELLTVTTENEAARPQTTALRARLARMATTEPEELFLERLEHTASSDRAASGLGLISLKKDYGARLAAEIRLPVPTIERFVVSLQLVLNVDAIERS